MRDTLIEKNLDEKHAPKTEVFPGRRHMSVGWSSSAINVFGSFAEVLDCMWEQPEPESWHSEWASENAELWLNLKLFLHSLPSKRIIFNNFADV